MKPHAIIQYIMLDLSHMNRLPIILQFSFSNILELIVNTLYLSYNI